MAIDDPASDAALRERALRHLRRRRGFLKHVPVYVLVNALLVVIWATGSYGFFWPIFTILGWGIGVAMNAWAVY